MVAEEQTNGRGRLTRHWHSPKFTGIWMSIVLRPKLPPFKAPQFTLITAVAVVQAIEQLCDLQPEIKWPNDILIKGKKVTGILTELQADSDKIHSIIIGIGINVNQTREDFPEELHSVATSIAIENGGKLSRSILIQQILANLEKYYQIYLEKGFAPLSYYGKAMAISIGKDIIARTVNEVIAGKAIGISDEGVLKIQDKNGVIHDIYSADIEVGK